MNRKKRVFIISILVLFVIVIGGIGFLYGRYGLDSAGNEKNEKQSDANTVAKVKTSHVQSAIMHKTIGAYGNVIAAPENVQVFAVPFESKVSGVPVTPGQMVMAGTVLMEVEPTHEALLQLDEAKSAKKTAEMDVNQIKRKLELKLGTLQDVVQAERTLELARIRLTNLKKRGIAATQIKTQTDGLVSKIKAQPGQIVTAGNPLVEIATGSKFEIRLGIEPADMAQLQPGLSVGINNVNAAEPNGIIGKIRLISNRINPSNRLIDVFVTVPDACGLPLDTYVHGNIIVGSKQTLAVPRLAVLSDSEHHYIFTIKDGKAVKRSVDIGLEDRALIEIISNELKAGEAVVIEGNYELEDGIAVEAGDAR